MLVKTAVRKVVVLGHPALRAPARLLSPEEIKDGAVQRLVQEMFATMAEYRGVGLAANQVGLSLSLFVMGLEAKHPRHEGGIPPTAVFNPQVRFLGAEKASDFEGCLSAPGLRGEVSRYLKLELSGLDSAASPFTMTCEGFPARVVQHECDHLMGRVYLDRMGDLASLSYA